MFQPGFLGGGAVTALKTDSGTATGVVYQFGSPSPDRIMAVAFSVVAGAAALTSVTIGGVVATLVAKINFSASDTAEIWEAPVPLGSSGLISTTTSGALSGFGLTVFAVKGAGATFDTKTSTTTSVNLNVPAGGAAIAVSTNVNSGASSFTWTGLTEDTDFSIAATAESSAASGAFNSAATVTVTATPSGSLAHGIAAVSWRQ